jgi:hypothetical protein
MSKSASQELDASGSFVPKAGSDDPKLQTFDDSAESLRLRQIL